MAVLTRDEALHVIGKFAVQHPSLDLTKVLVAGVRPEKDALFFIPLTGVRALNTSDGRRGTAALFEIHVHSLSTGKLVDVGSISTDPWNLERDFTGEIDRYVQDSCYQCIEQAELCHDHLPPNGVKWISMMCEECSGYDEESGHYDVNFLFVRMCKDDPQFCCERGPIYRCTDCGTEVHDPS